MKNKILYILGLMLLSSLVVFNSCEEKDDYNYDDIEPVVSEMAGPTEVRGGTTVTYRAYGRDGSTYDFSHTGAIEGVGEISDEPYALVVDFEEEMVDTLTASISVTETTIGGKTSPEKTVDISVLPLSIKMSGTEVFAISEDDTEGVEAVYTLDFQYPEATYAWEVTGAGADVVTIDNGTESSQLEITIDYPTDLSAEFDVSVTVTTRGGNVLEDNISVTAWQFCELDLEGLFVEEWIGTAQLTDGTPIESDPVLIMDPLDLPEDILDNPFVTVGLPPAFEDYENVVLIDGLADNLINVAWGEAWVDRGFSLAILHEPAGEVEIPLQFLGESNYPDNYWIIGYGEYNYCVPSITIHYAVGYGGPASDVDPGDVDMEGDITWIFGWDEEEGAPVYISTDLTVKGAKNFFQNEISYPIRNKR